jgi:hypothetical protein
VAWSFAMKALAVLVLRFKEPQAERWKVPLNLRLRGTELPIGLALITIVLFSIASINLLTKPTATIWGGTFTITVFVILSVCERRFRAKESHKPKLGEEPERERFRLELRENLSPSSLQVRPANVLAGVHRPDRLEHLDKALKEIDTRNCDIIALSVNENVRLPAQQITDPAQVIDDCEISVFSNVVHVAEKVGKPVRPVAVPGTKPYELILEAAYQLRSSRAILHSSATMSAPEQQHQLVTAWDRLGLPGTLWVEIIGDRSQPTYQFRLGK